MHERTPARRALQRWPDLLEGPDRAVITLGPKGIGKGDLAARAVQVMAQHGITLLLIMDGQGRPEAVIHMHVLRMGVV